ncbi:YqzH family protein [Fictibacillus aquaticus]|uniref:YqzH family protein n=1 Tax=Fictibacillus aquaticus TaxID=2021314 RepID=UPI0013FD7675|nr:YqzH family protein [Fictibacillus aquaticus]
MSGKWTEKMITKALADYFGSEETLPFSKEEYKELAHKVLQEWNGGENEEAFYSLVHDAVYDMLTN